MIDNFAVFILTHGRPDKVITYDTLKRQGYTGDVYIIVDDEDRKVDAYREKFGDAVIVFDKKEIARTHDEGDNFNDRRSVFYARNASFQIARDLGVEYFLQLDDDYRSIFYKFDKELRYKERQCMQLDRLFALILDYYKGIPATTIAMGQNGDFVGGGNSDIAKRLSIKRKAMNSFFCSIHRPFRFMGRVNEDVNTYVTLGHRGELLFSFFSTSVKQMDTQSNAGGMTEMYLDSGTYIKSFYTVMYSPSCAIVSEMPSTHRRIHHKINWKNAVPCIVGEEHRKQSQYAT